MARDVRGDLNVQRTLLFDGDPGSDGQVPRSQGPGLPTTWVDANGNTHYFQDTKPTAGVIANDTWQDTSNPKLPTYRYVDDGTSLQWVQFAVEAVSAVSSGSPNFIQATTPTVEQINGATTYSWWQTIGDDITLWIEDGT